MVAGASDYCLKRGFLSITIVFWALPIEWTNGHITFGNMVTNYLGRALKELVKTFSLSGITRTGSMGLISACFLKAPLIR